MNIFTVLLGIVLAGTIFAAFVWSAYQSFFAQRRLRLAHITLVLLTLLGFAALSQFWPRTASIAGAGLVLAGLAALRPERGWARLLLAVQIAFGALLLTGLPFTGG